MRLSVDKINEKSPYWVLQLSDMQFRFITRNGIVYRVGFYPDEYFMKDKAYQFFIDNVDEVRAPKDTNVYKVIAVILEEFFNYDSSVMLYICDPRDKRESVRAALYKRWFDNYSQRDKLTLRDAELNFKGYIVYSGMILRNDNPEYQRIVENFDAFVERVPSVYNVNPK